MSFNKSVTKNANKVFLKLPRKHLPKTRKLDEKINCNSVNVSNSCTENIGEISNSHN